ncbi:MAG TPA: MGMT family protein [Candidatus Saccharimonadales bacterium]|nr:MGMT family protein [Candidatus Saccharimonadales bacterium]
MKPEEVYSVVSQIPKGKVTTYGQLARLIGTGPRVVGAVLHQNRDPENIPCHRVIHSDGTLAGGYAFGGEGIQRKLLENEGISFKKNKIDLRKFVWSHH